MCINSNQYYMHPFVTSVCFNMLATKVILATLVIFLIYPEVTQSRFSHFWIKGWWEHQTIVLLFGNPKEILLGWKGTTGKMAKI